MKNISLVLAILLIAAILPCYADISFTAYQGDTLVVKLPPQLVQGQPGAGLFVSWANSDQFYPVGVNNSVVVGVDINTRPDRYNIALVYGTNFSSPYGYIQVLKKFPKRMCWTRPNKVRKEEAEELRHIYDFAMENFSYLGVDSLFAYPLNQKIDQKDKGSFGYSRGCYNHRGTDLVTCSGDNGPDCETEVVAVNKGFVVFAGELSVEGKTVVIYHGKGIFSFYIHLSDIKVAMHQSVETGDIIGLSGDSGNAKGNPHLHFEIKIYGAVVDPLEFISKFDEVLK